MKWVTVKKLAELSGYSEKAIHIKKERGIWLEGIHWKKSPDGRLQFNIEAIELWIEGIAA